MIDFELDPQTAKAHRRCIHTVAEQHDAADLARIRRARARQAVAVLRDDVGGAQRPRPRSAMPMRRRRRRAASGAAKLRNLYTVLSTEELCWGDAGLFLSIPNAGLGGAAVMAAGTPEQKERFLKRFHEGKPKWGAMAITEPGCGSDSAAVTTTATRDGDRLGDQRHQDFLHRAARWRSRSPTASSWSGRPSTRAPDAPGSSRSWSSTTRPGMTVARVENKLGIRASDTAALIFDNCRVPADHLLGSAEVKRDGRLQGRDGDLRRDAADRRRDGDRRRPRGARLRPRLSRRTERSPIRYGISPRRLTAVERDFMEMEVQLKAARLLTWRAAWMLDMGMRNSLEASMAKAKAGLAVTLITQKAVELLGPLGYSRKHAGREMDARREDQRHLRGHAADQHDDRRAAHPGVQQQGTELSGGAQRAEYRKRKGRLKRPAFVFGLEIRVYQNHLPFS